jgi:hypothetical protein
MNVREPLRQTITVREEDFWLTLICRDDLSFSVVLKYDLDSGTFVSGREKGPLEIMYGHFTDSRTLEIFPSDEPAAVAERVVNERW